MRVRISHEMASRKMLKFSSLALNQIFRRVLSSYKFENCGMGVPTPNPCVFGSRFFWYTIKNISCEIFSKIIHFQPKRKSKKEKTKIVGNLN